MIEMIYFHGSIGKGGEGRHFFLIYVSKNILHLMIQMIYFDRSVGKRAWERERGNGTVGTSYDSNDYFDWSMGTFFLVVDFPILYSFLEFHDKIFVFLHNMIPHSL